MPASFNGALSCYPRCGGCGTHCDVLCRRDPRGAADRALRWSRCFSLCHKEWGPCWSGARRHASGAIRSPTGWRPIWPSRHLQEAQYSTSSTHASPTLWCSTNANSSATVSPTSPAVCAYTAYSKLWRRSSSAWAIRTASPSTRPAWTTRTARSCCSRAADYPANLYSE